MDGFRARYKRNDGGVTLTTVKKLIIAVIGSTVVLIGIALIVLPGPAFIVIPAGLAILATEFVWAERLLHNGKRHFKKLRARDWRFWMRKRKAGQNAA